MVYILLLTSSRMLNYRKWLSKAEEWSVINEEVTKILSCYTVKYRLDILMAPNF